MATSTKPLALTVPAARSAMMIAQGFGEGDAAKKPEEALERWGFVRTLGGVDVYVAVRARCPTLRRADLDHLVLAGEAQVLPAARGCIYLVPRRHAALALRIAEQLSRARDLREHAKAGIRKGEIEDVAAAALETLAARGPLTTDALRRAMPEGSVRSLGDAGKKVGISSPLPPALRRLEFEGRISRTPEGGRLDTERYLWTRTKKSPLEGSGLPADDEGLHARLAALFFAAAGLARPKDFAEWSGLGARAAAAATAAHDLVEVAVAGSDEPHLATEAFAASLGRSKPAATREAFLPFDDNLLALHGSAPRFFVDAAYHGLVAPTWGKATPATLGEARYVSMRPIFAEGSLKGFWELDPAAGEVVTSFFAPAGAAVKKRIAAEAERLARFLVDEVGHGRSFSLDTDEDLVKRSALLRGARLDGRKAAPPAKAPRAPAPAKAKKKTAKKTATARAGAAPSAKVRRKPR